MYAPYALSARCCALGRTTCITRCDEYQLCWHTSHGVRTASESPKMPEDDTLRFVFVFRLVAGRELSDRTDMFSSGGSSMPAPYSRLYPSSPRTPRVRSTYIVPFCFAAVLLLLALLFPSVVENAHCQLGFRKECQPASVSQATSLYNRFAIQRSCQPTREGGNVVVVTGSAGVPSRT
jgi:hypothetical protein